MTATLPPRLRTLDETQALPTMSDTEGWSADTVWRIARRMSAVDVDFHRREVHPNGEVGCPWCPPVKGEAPDRSSETYWREVANRPATGLAA